MSKIELIQGDCLEKMKDIPDGSVDAIITDPPYGLSFMGKHWDKGVPGVHFWEEMIRVLKPGGHLLSFSGTRTYHRMAVAIEDAGFEIRDMIEWVYGSGFPKSMNIGKAIDRQRKEDEPRIIKVAERMKEYLIKSGKSKRQIDDYFGTANVSQYWFSPHRNPQIVPADKWVWVREFLQIGDELDLEVWQLNGNKGQPGETFKKREVVGLQKKAMSGWNMDGTTQFKDRDITKGTSEWEGWGTALKPAHEPICMARKPLAEKTVALNVLKWGTGGIDIDGSRVGTDGGETHQGGFGSGIYGDSKGVDTDKSKQQGKFPANLIHDNSEEVRECFPETKSGSKPGQKGKSIIGSENGETR